jgi:phage gp36-like protein
MTYATRANMEAIHSADFIARLVDLDDDGNDEAQVDDALAAATSEIDSHLGQRYRVPLAVVPAFIRQYCIDIAIYGLANTASRLTDEMKDRKEAAVKHLMRIADGKATLGEAEDANRAEADPDTGSSSIMIDADDRRFTADSMKGL